MPDIVADGDNLGDHIATKSFKQIKGSDVASGNAITLGFGGNTFDVTGTTTINHINNTNWGVGSIVIIHFDGVTTLTNNAGTLSGNEANILLSGDVNYTTSAGDILTFVLHDITNWQEISRNSSGVIADASITNAKLSSNAVTTDKIADGTILNADINSSAGITTSKILDFDAKVQLSKLNQMATPTADVALGSQKITGLADGVANADAVTKGQLNTAVASNITLKGGYDATNDNPHLDSGTRVAIAIGDHYVVTVAGTFYSEVLQAGDSLISTVASPTSFGQWIITNNNVVTPIVTANIANGAVTTDKIADGTILNADINSSAGITISKISGFDTEVSNNSSVTANTAKVSLTDNSVTLARLAHGTADKYLGFNSSGVPEEKTVSAGGSGNEIYGNGTDGDVTISSNTTLTELKYYNNLTINSGITLDGTSPQIIYVKDTLTVNGSLSMSGKGGAGGSISGQGGSATNLNATGGAGGGISGTAGTVGTGGASANSGSIGSSGSAGTGGAGGGGGGGGRGYSNSSGGMTSGSNGAQTQPYGSGGGGVTTIRTVGSLIEYLYTKGNLLGSGGGGGSKGGVGGTGGNGAVYSSSGGGGSGGVGGSGGGSLIIIAKNVIIGGSGSIVSQGLNGSSGSAGGNGGNGGSGGWNWGGGGGGGGGCAGGGGGGGSGGFISLYYTTLSNSGTLSVSGGSAGSNASTGGSTSGGAGGYGTNNAGGYGGGAGAGATSIASWSQVGAGGGSGLLIQSQI